MKKTIFILCASILFAGCQKWLDINQNPNSADASVPTPEQRLPPLLAQFADCYESSGTRAAFLTQQLGVTYAVNNNWNLTRWFSNVSSANWPWQSWYVNTAVNVQPLIEASQKVDAFHYIGVAKIMKAWGFGFLSEFYGMMPYDDFGNPATIQPRFDDASYIFEKVIALLDEGIADLNKTQGATAPALAKGDIYNKGNVDNWIRLAYGLKARFLNHLVKTNSYNPQSILDALSKAPQIDAQSTIMQYVDESPNTSSAKEALQYTNTGTTARITKLYYDFITNNYTDAPTGNNNMEDPRIDSLIPRMSNSTGALIRTVPMDMKSDLPKTGPAGYTYNASTNRFSHKDSVYVHLRRTPANPTAGQRIQSTGTWYTNRASKGLFLTNAEMRFIEAEVKFRQGQKNDALTSYKAGIRSHMNLMGINASVIDAFLNSTSVIQNSGQLTLSHIMIQKYIAMSYSVENWADMRRNNFCADAGGNYNEATGIYKGYNRPSHVYTESYPSPTDWPRRFAVPSYEINFNIDKVLEADKDASKATYLNKAIWWDK